MTIAQKIRELGTRLAKHRRPSTSAIQLLEREVAEAIDGLVRGRHDGMVSLPAIRAQHPYVTLQELSAAVTSSYGRRRGRLRLSRTVLNHPKPGLFLDVDYELELGAEELCCRLRR